MKRVKANRERLCWTLKRDMKLVDFVKERKYIWKHTANHEPQVRLKAYTEFAEKVCGGEVTAAAVKIRWDNILGTFNCNMKKIEASRKVARSKEDLYKPTWHLWEACSFLRERIRHSRRKTKISDALDADGIKEELQGTSDNDYRDTDTDNHQIFHQDINQLEENAREDNLTEADMLGSSLFADDSIKHSDSRESKTPGDGKPIKQCDKVLEDLLRVLGPLQECLSKDLYTQEVNADFIFVGRHVTERLSKMRPFDAECATQKIMDVLVLYSESNPNNPNNTKANNF